jgi:hypothetical protein
MFSLGGIVEKVCDAVGAPEWVGDVATIAVGVVSRDPLTIMDGIADLTPNVCDTLEDKLDLSEPGDQPWWKDALKDVLDFQRGSAAIYERSKGALGPALSSAGPV